MGMFDYMRCEMPLPEPAPPPDTLFQTKDVPTAQLYLEHWKITADGSLLHEESDYRMVEDAQAPLGFWQMRENKRWVPVDHHGDIEFYHLGDDGQWWAYKARFTEGRCTRIFRVP